MKILTWQAMTEMLLTHVQLATMTVFSMSTLNIIEYGRTSPTLYQLDAIANALGVRITDLFESERK